MNYNKNLEVTMENFFFKTAWRKSKCSTQLRSGVSHHVIYFLAQEAWWLPPSVMNSKVLPLVFKMLTNLYQSNFDFLLSWINANQTMLLAPSSQNWLILMSFFPIQCTDKPIPSLLVCDAFIYWSFFWHDGGFTCGCGAYWLNNDTIIILLIDIKSLTSREQKDLEQS